MTTISDSSPSPAALRHQESLTESISSMRSRIKKITIEGLLLTVGALCLPIGIITIILGWYGAAHTGHVYEQNDYLISGGLLGLGLIFIGGFLYFGYWMTRQIRATEAGTQQTLRALARIEAQGRGGSVGGSDAADTGEIFVVTEHGSMLHRPTCPAVADRSVRIVAAEEAVSHQPCSVCEPLG